MSQEISAINPLKHTHLNSSLSLLNLFEPTKFTSFKPLLKFDLSKPFMDISSINQSNQFLQPQFESRLMDKTPLNNKLVTKK